MIRSFFILLTVALSSCSTVDKQRQYSLDYERYIQAGQCKDAQEVIPLEKDDSNVLRFYQGSIGYISSVGVLSASVLLDLILLGRCRYGCSDRDKEILDILFPTTTWTYEATKDMRCPDNSYYIRKLLEVARCYEDQNSVYSLAQAHEQLQQLLERYDDGPTCIQNRDAQVIKMSIARVNHKRMAIKKN